MVCRSLLSFKDQTEIHVNVLNVHGGSVDFIHWPWWQLKIPDPFYRLILVSGRRQVTWFQVPRASPALITFSFFKSFYEGSIPSNSTISRYSSVQVEIVVSRIMIRGH
jgi:hypothetical protein